jgi:glycosyltransferase involved in cell wall biosynthesis
MTSYNRRYFKSLIRSVLAEITYHLYYRFDRRWDRARNGDPLKKGITAVVAARNEAYTLPLCLRSLLGVVDQIVCVDNGSDDGTLQIMHDFQRQHGHEVEVDVVSLPGALLGDCREAGLKATKYQWHLRWDADMVCKTSGDENMRTLRETVLPNDRPRAIQLPRTNLIGDLHHATAVHKVVDPGEPILIRFGRHICYKEYGKFDAVRLPLYYATEKSHRKFYFHCAGLKCDSNLRHRFFYFKWREQVNATAPEQRTAELLDFDQYRRRREMEVFGTNDVRSLNFRFQRLNVSHHVKYDESKYGEYPEILKQEIEAGRERFKVVYRDGRPYCRIDYEDKEMLDYKPTQEDLDWDPTPYLRSVLNESQLTILGIK